MGRILVLTQYCRIIRKLRRQRLAKNADRIIQRLRVEYPSDPNLDGRSYLAPLSELGLSKQGLADVQKELADSAQVTIAKIDENGLLLSRFGTIEGYGHVASSQFVRRRRFDVSIVAIGNTLALRKSFRGNKSAFINELSALRKLGQAGCSVPSLLEVEFDDLTVTMSFIIGPSATEESSEFVQQLFTQVHEIHSQGIILWDVRPQNIIVEKRSGRPYLIDFDFAVDYTGLMESSLALLRNYDLDILASYFKQEKEPHISTGRLSWLNYSTTINTGRKSLTERNIDSRVAR